MSPLTPLLNLYRQRGHVQYSGEDVTQLEHALQCATLAEAANSSAALITAALFHDLGYLVHHLGKDLAEQGDDRHEYRAIPLLKTLFPETVIAPIRLHVAAKRYLCAAEEDYWASLSDVSKVSLELQGGIFDREAAATFIRQLFAREAIALRRWDDTAKVVDLQTPDLEHFVPFLEAVRVE
ncbi:MAG: phosphonate degradation HD-domain oxygenase [Cyanobacteria bacterium P01_G01_bin.54]